MKTNKQKAVALLIAILLAITPLGAAAPSGISESATLKIAESWMGG